MKGLLKSTTMMVAAAALTAGATAASAAEIELNVISWGGAYTASQLRAYHEPYMAENPEVQLNSIDYSGGLAEVRAQTEAGNVTWDLIDTTVSDSIRGCDEGLFMPIDHDGMLDAAPDGTMATEDFMFGTEYECFVPLIIYSTAFAFRTDVAEWGGNLPTSINDVFDLDNFPGKRTLQRSPPHPATSVRHRERDQEGVTP